MEKIPRDNSENKNEPFFACDRKETKEKKMSLKDSFKSTSYGLNVNLWVSADGKYGEFGMNHYPNDPSSNWNHILRHIDHSTDFPSFSEFMKAWEREKVQVKAWDEEAENKKRNRS